MEYTTLTVEDKDKTPFFENIALYFVIGVMFLLPIFFIPSLAVPFSFTKSLLIFVSILVAFFLFLISKLKEGEVVLPRNNIALVAWCLPVAYFVSALFSPNPAVSFLGQGFEIDTFGYIAIMVLMLSLIPLLLKTRESIFRIHITIFFSLVILVIFQGLRLIFGTDFLSFDIFNATTSNLLGKWNDLGIFFGLTTLLSLITLEGLTLNKLFKIIIYIVLSISVLFLAITDFFQAWIIIGLFALGLFMFNFFKGKFKFKSSENMPFGETTSVENNKKKTLIPSFIILIISLLIVFGGTNISGYMASKFNIVQIEARPSWETTINITKKTYGEHLLFGSGPNTFVSQWTMYKPQSINNTVFWNIDFNSGIGIVPTSFATTGLVGALAWILFFAIFLYSGFRNIFMSEIGDRASYYLLLSLFLGSLYLWIFTVIYIPNVVIVTLAFLLTGMYIASLRYRSGPPIEKKITFESNPRIGFIAILILTILLIVSGLSIYKVGKKYLSAVYFQKAIIASNIDFDIDIAEENVAKAIKYGNNDKYYRLSADINLARINEILTDSSKQIEIRQKEFQSTLAKAISNAQKAIEIDDKNYQNWSMLGRVYGSVVPLNVEGSYESAKRSYESALALNPHNPAIFLTLARLELTKDSNNIGKAKEFIGQAIREKSNYTEAIFMLSQIETQAGNIEEAIRSVEATVILEPNNPLYFFQLGLLNSNIGNTTNAIYALERAVEINNQYANARYFLGLNYFKVGKIAEAIEQFEVIEDLNPDNKDVKRILSNLQLGNDPFTAIEPIETLPIESE